MLRLLLGGARSGESSLAVAFGQGDGGPVCFLATAEGRDDELRQRIERHRAERPTSWTTIEEPPELDAVLSTVPSSFLVIVDCLTLWVSNCLGIGLDGAVVARRARRFVEVALARERSVVVVSNEVGSGIVPPDPLSRRYRDVLGQVNAIVAAAASEAHLVVAGRLLSLELFETTALGSPRSGQ